MASPRDVAGTGTGTGGSFFLMSSSVRASLTRPPSCSAVSKNWTVWRFFRRSLNASSFTAPAPFSMKAPFTSALSDSMKTLILAPDSSAHSYSCSVNDVPSS